jgi:hypothetical protein
MKTTDRHCGRDMRNIVLNHVATSHQLFRPAHAILSTGLLATVLLMLVWSQLDARQAMLDASLERLRNPAMRSLHGTTSKDAQNAEMVAVQAAMDELALPWEALLQGLEAMGLDEIRLLSIEPAPRQRKLRIMAEASRAGAMLEYVHALEQLPMLKGVVLQRQEKGDNERQVFSVEAVWNVQHER